MGQVPVYIAIILLLVFMLIAKVFLPIGLLFLILIILWPQRKEKGAKELFGATILFLLLYIIIRYFSILLPFIIGAGVSYIIAPLIDSLERRKIPRVIAILSVLIPLLAIVPAVLFLLASNLINELRFLITRIPEFVDQSKLLISSLVERLNKIGFNITPELIMNAFNNYLGTILNGLLQTVFQIGQGVKGIVLLIYNYILSPIITYLLLNDREKIKAWIESQLSESERNSFNLLLKKLNISLARYFRGQFLMMIIVGFIIGFFLWLLGVRYYVILGITAAFCNLIPNVGFIISLIIALVMGFLTPPYMITIVKVVAVYLGEQLLENLLLGPLIIGKAAQLHPAVVMLALILCGTAGGFWGLVLAIPILIFARELLNHLLDFKL